MRVFYLVLVLLYGGWLWWYGGTGEPVTAQEVNVYLDRVADNARAGGREPNPQLMEEFQTLARTDDGNEFYMLNLIRWRDKALYPADSPFADDPDPMAANARYSKGIIPALLRHGGLPVFIGEPGGRFIEDGDVYPWDFVGIVRYRSVRDMLEMVAEPGMMELAPHKWASIQQTHVFPVRPQASLVMVRLVVAAALVAIALIVTGIVRLLSRQR
jgi:hypothetical protein